MKNLSDLLIASMWKWQKHYGKTNATSFLLAFCSKLAFEIADWRSRHWFLKRCTSRPLHEIFSGFLDTGECSRSPPIGGLKIRGLM